MNVKPLFPSCLWTDQINLDNKSLEEFAYEHRSIDQRPVFNGGWQSDRLPTDTVELQPLVDAVKKLLPDLKHFMGVKQELEERIPNCWININEPGNFSLNSNPPHFHPNHFLSCVYYVKAERNAGALTLMAPFAGIEYALPFPHISQYNTFNSSRERIAPEPGKLIIFPSWLMHFVESNNSSTDRISIVLNVALPNIDL